MLGASIFKALYYMKGSLLIKTTPTRMPVKLLGGTNATQEPNPRDCFVHGDFLPLECVTSNSELCRPICHFSRFQNIFQTLSHQLKK